jgi:hypothetical protein
VSQRDGIPDHDCVEFLLKERFLDKESIGKQKAENELLKSRIQELEQRVDSYASENDLDPMDVNDPMNINNFSCMFYIEEKISSLFEEQ